MRLLLVSDLHYTLKQLDWVHAAAADFDVVVLAGDHLDIASAVDPDAQIAVVLEYLARMAARTTVIACSGNHDLNARNDVGERAAEWLTAARAGGAFVDGSAFATDDTFVTVCPWWDGPQTRDRVDEQFAHDAALVGDRRWIWVYHAPPDASPTSWTGKRHYGDADLNKWIDAYGPAIVLCGHVHQSPFARDGGWIHEISGEHGSTVVLNAGRQRGPIPARIELDTAAGLVAWLSLDGIDERALTPA
jgi:Icc-related predicted phosphoesterase